MARMLFPRALGVSSDEPGYKIKRTKEMSHLKNGEGDGWWSIDFYMGNDSTSLTTYKVLWLK